MAQRMSLFQGYGVELEYMLVDIDTLEVKPVVDELIRNELGTYGSDVEKGIVTWSNELVLHVLELKSARPEHDLVALEKAFVENIRYINSVLQQWNIMLMPSAAHPFMDPLKETKLWPHDNNEVYDIYNRIFDCRGHGWSNLQSTHLNLPFASDAEFGALHAAIRILLPLLPACCASSPILDGKFSGVQDTRLTYYRTNQAKIPVITGKVIPEPVFTEEDYAKVIYAPIQKAIADFDPDEILEPVWVNSRGAISRFDRGSIEIRIMDIQECPKADLAIVTLVTETLKALVAGKFMDQEVQRAWNTETLAAMLDDTTSNAQAAVLDNDAYLAGFRYPGKRASAKELWLHILQELSPGNALVQPYEKTLKSIFEHGPLSKRILQAIDGNYSMENIRRVYKDLAVCLESNKLFNV